MRYALTDCVPNAAAGSVVGASRDTDADGMDRHLVVTERTLRHVEPTQVPVEPRGDRTELVAVSGKTGKTRVKKDIGKMLELTHHDVVSRIHSRSLSVAIP